MFDCIQFIGTQRSGSNLLRLMLNQHPLISAHHPPHLLRTFIPLIERYGDMAQLETREMLVRDMCNWVKKNPVSWAPVSFDVEDISEKSNDIVDIFEAIYKTKLEQDKAAIWCCKSTHNTKYLDKIKKKLNCFYIYLYRDGRDVALSFKKAIVGPKHMFCIGSQWNEEQQIAQSFINGLERNQYIAISYEMLVKNPRAILLELCEKLDIDFEESMLNYYVSKESKLTALAGNMWQNVSKPILEHNVSKYQTELDQEEIEMFESVAKKSLLDLDYPLQTLGDLEFS